MPWLKEIYQKKKRTVEEAVGIVQSSQRVYFSANAATPYIIMKALAARKDEVENVELVHMLLLGKDPFSGPEMEGHFYHNALFVGTDRDSVNEGRSGYIPTHLHQIPQLLTQGHLPIDIAIVQTSPPDEHGFLSLGVEVVSSKTAVETAKQVVAHVNPQMPRTLGNSFIHISQVDIVVEQEAPLITLESKPYTEIEGKIAQYITEMIEDGATLQLGIGGIPNAVLALLEGKRDLGIHTEMVSDGIMEAVNKGIITGAKKNFHPGKVIATFILGSQNLYEYVHDNPFFELHPVDYTNDPFIVGKNDNLVAINSAIEIDFTGQVCSDSIGTRIYSGFGGQLDFIRGAARSKNGKPIIALPSTAKGDKFSRIVPTLKVGAGVVTTRADAHYVVTEYGVAYLYGKNLQQRVRALIDIAHPKFREELEKEAYQRKLLPPKFPI